MYEAFGGGGGGVGIYVWMNLVCTNLGGTTLGVGRPKVGMNLISALPCTFVGVVSIVSGGDVQVVGNGDVVGDVGRQVSSFMDGDRDMSPWENVWDRLTSLCAMEPMS